MDACDMGLLEKHDKKLRKWRRARLDWISSRSYYILAAATTAPVMLDNGPDNPAQEKSRIREELAPPGHKEEAPGALLPQAVQIFPGIDKVMTQHIVPMHVYVMLNDWKMSLNKFCKLNMINNCKIWIKKITFPNFPTR